MKFGLLYEMEVLKPWGPTSQFDTFWHAIEQVKLAEQLGFHYAWAVEHHFLDQYSLSSAPEIWLAALAQHTTRIRVGHGVVLLPFGYNHPIRVAERAATLDILSKGRLEVGTGRSITLTEMEGFGVDPSLTRAQWREAIRMLPRMWCDDEFSWNSDLITIPTRPIIPKPIQKPYPPLWMSGSQPSSGEIAGEYGLGFMHFSLTDPVNLADKVQLYRNGIQKAALGGGAVNNQFAAFTLMYCGDTAAKAFEDSAQSCEWYTNISNKLYGMWKTSDDPTFRWYRERADEKRAGVDARELAECGAVCIGDRKRCIEIVQWYESQGVDQLIFLVQFGRLSHEQICASLQRFSGVLHEFS